MADETITTPGASALAGAFQNPAVLGALQVFMIDGRIDWVRWLEDLLDILNPFPRM